MNILIIEDEPLAAERMAELVKKYDASIEICAQIPSVKNAVEWLNNNPHPDLILMDIQLEDGLSFEIFEQVKVLCPVIFTTAYDEYTIKAFKVNSVDYLLKPVDYSELVAALNKFQTFFGPQNQKKADPDTHLYEKLLNQLGHKYKNRFIVKVGQHIRSVPVDDIIYFYTTDKNSFICASSGRSYALDYSLDQIESLINPEVFFRINRKYLVNWNAIEDIQIYSGSRLKIVLKKASEEDMTVSREKVKEFKDWLDR